MRTGLLLCLLLISLPLLSQEDGYASWYGGKFNGRLTASGEVYDMEQLTAAHKTLPFGTIIKVTNQKNRKSILVRINDRGPFVEGRVIDLSQAAAEAIEMVADGIAYVTLEIMQYSKQVGSETYSIQVGAYSKKENAYAVREQLEAAGMKVTFETTKAQVIRVLVIDINPEEIYRIKSGLNRLAFTELLVKKQLPGY